MGWTSRMEEWKKKRQQRQKRVKNLLVIEAAEHRKAEGKIKFRSRFANAMELAWVCELGST